MHAAITARGAERSAAKRAVVVVAAGLVWVTLQTAGLLGPLGGVTFVALGVGAVVATVVGLVTNRPSPRWPWIVITSALVVFLVGGAARQSLGTVGDLSAHRSLVPDFITLPGYVLIAIGYLGLARSRRPDRANHVDALLDGAVAGLSAMTLAWLFLVNPALFHQDAPLSVRLVLSVYPPLSIFVVVITAHMAFSGGTSATFSYRLLLAAAATMLFGDVLYMLVETHLVSAPEYLRDVPYALAYLALIGCVLHPSMTKLTEPLQTDEIAPTRGRIALVALALGIPGLITVTRANAATGDRLALGTIMLALTATATWRVLRALRAHARSEARLSYQVTHDELTGLPNRAYVSEALALRLGRRRHTDRKVAVLFLDVDRFKLVNDSYGHGFGDELLIAAAQRLRATARDDDVVARIGGDEFVVVLDGLRSVEEALHVAERTRLAMLLPFDVGGREIASSVSIGVAYADRADLAAEDLVRDADTAMYQAKEAGRNAVTVFDSSMRDRATRRLALERDLRHAIDRGELHLHYQPVVRLSTGGVEGFEGLLRWSHPTWGNVPPLSFIPVAEDTGQIVEIGAWVLDEGCRQLAEWRRELGADLYMSLNLSARQLRDPHLIERVERALVRHGVPPSALRLELTESVLMHEPAVAAEILGRLRGLGVSLSIDDFGTGYSSLAYLKRFRVDHVKIDRAFVNGLDEEGSSDASLVEAIVAMAGALGVTTCAEGVETSTQAERLRGIGCDVVQGYLFSRPVAPDEIPRMLERLGIARVTRLRAVPAVEIA